MRGDEEKEQVVLGGPDVRLCPWCLQSWPCPGRCYVHVVDARRAGALLDVVLAYPDAFEVRQLKPEFQRRW